MELTLQPLLSHRCAELAAFLERAFQGYLVPLTFRPEHIAGMVRCDAVDLTASHLALRDGEAAGLALIARRGAQCRIAAMGVFPEARGSGVGRRMMERLLAEAQERGERAMLLEVIEQNTAAVRLYESVGFRVARRLVGYTAEGGGETGDREAGSDALEEVEFSEVARALMTHGSPDLPWQVSGGTLAQMSLPARGFRQGAAFAALSDVAQPVLSLRALVVAPDSRRQGQARRLVRALRSRFPEKTWKVPILWPEECAPGLFESLGFVRETLTQLQMRRDFPIGPEPGNDP